MSTTHPASTYTVREGDARRARRDRRMKVFRAEVLPRIILIVMCLVFILPFYWMFSQSLKSNTELAAYPPTLYPHEPKWENYKRATEVFPFWDFARNTAIITVGSVIGALVSNPIIAYGFSRLNWAGRDKVFMIVLATVFMPFPVIIVALFDIFSRLGWINTPLPLVVPAFFGSAFFVFLLRQFMLQLPKDLSDAARIDGANEWEIFSQVIMPLCRPALGAIGIFAGLGAWNDFLGPLLYLTDPKWYTLSIGMTFFQSQADRDIKFNLLMAASVLVIIPVVAMFLLFQKAFIQGMTVGGIKG